MNILLRTLAVTCVALSLVAPAPTTAKPKNNSQIEFSFMKHRVGDSKETFTEIKSCKSPKSSRVLDCDTDGTLNFADMGFIGVNYKFVDDKFYWMEGFVGESWAGHLRELLVGKYGSPSIERATNGQLRSGGHLPGFESVWRFRDGVLTMRMNFPDADTVTLDFESPPLSHLASNAETDAEHEAGRTAF